MHTERKKKFVFLFLFFFLVQERARDDNDCMWERSYNDVCSRARA